MNHYEHCTLCPRKCGVDRTGGQLGFCGGADKAAVAKTMIHRWEEPVLAPGGKSGTIFFGGCSLGCCYCQNRAISTHCAGEELDAAQLRQRMEQLIAQGAENIDLVTPSHFLPTVCAALEGKLPVPVVYNCGGYETVESLRLLQGKVDIYLPDMKYADNALAKRLSGVADYFQVASAAITEMVRQRGKAVFDGNKLISGTVIRHLILPGQVENSLRVLDWIGEHFSAGEVLVSLMRQYTPMPNMAPPLDRKITQEEYEAVLSWMYLNNLQGFTQEAESAAESFIPDFALTDE